MRLLAVLALLLVTSGARGQSIRLFPPADGPPRQRCTEQDNWRVCRVEADGEATMTITEGGQQTARWGVAYGVQAGEVAVFASDLDRDGGRDVLVATQEAVSNGLAVSYWRVDVIASGASTPAYSFTAEDFGARGQSFAHDGERLVIWVTDWVSGPDPRGRRPEGMYLTGRPFFLSSTGLVPASGLPLRARRLLNSFSRDAEEGPTGWLSDRRAESLRTDMALAGCRQVHDEVTVRSVTSREDENGETYTAITTDHGDLVYSLRAYVPDADVITHLGDAASGRLFPPDYMPRDLKDRFTGLHRLSTCAEGGSVDIRVLWL